MRTGTARLILALCLAAAFLLACNLFQTVDLSEPVATDALSPSPVLPGTETPTTAPATPPPAVVSPTAPAQRPIRHLSSGTSVNLAFIRMVDESRGWAIGGVADGQDHILLTADAGQTWRDVTPPELLPEPNQSDKIAIGFFANDQVGWVTYSHRDFFERPSQAVVWKTTNAGESWEVSDPLDYDGTAEFYAPSDLYFADSEHGWLLLHLGAGMQHDFVALMATLDGGRHWDRLVEPAGVYLQSCPKTGLVFADPLSGWVTRDCAGLVDGAFVDWTRDGGKTWEVVELPPPAMEPDLVLPPAACSVHSPNLLSPDAGSLVVSCLYSENEALRSSEFIYTTRNGGRSWAIGPFPGGTLVMMDSQMGWALGRDIYSTADWDGQFSFVSAEIGLAVAHSDGERALVRTEDGARNWQELRPVIAP